MPKYRAFAAGDPLPWFTARVANNPRYHFDTAGGYYVVIGLFGSLADPVGQRAMGAIRAQRSLFDDKKLIFFGVTSNPDDEKEGRAATELPGIRFVYDNDGAVARLLGALPIEPSEGAKNFGYRRLWIVADPMMRLTAVLPFGDDGADGRELAAIISALPPLDRFTGVEVHAPVLMLPNVFERDLCQHLMALYEQHGGQESGFMREVNGKTVLAHDYGHKRRSDYLIDDPELMKLLRSKVLRRVVPEIQKAHQFKATRMERYLVGCYEAETSGHFSAHRDNTTKGTAHRRFALSINLNEEFDGGELSFPEFGPRSFKPPPGAGVVFSCSLLHAVSAVKRGRRFAFLPFLYDEEAAKVREANSAFLGEGLGAYKA